MKQLVGVFGEVKNVMSVMWRDVMSWAFLIGQVVVVALLLSSLIVQLNLIAKALDFSPLFGGFYNIVSGIYKDPLAWAATSVSIGATVAIGHMINLEFNKEKINYDRDAHLEKRKKIIGERKQRTVKNSDKVY